MLLLKSKRAMTAAKNLTNYEDAVLAVLAFEFPSTDKEITEAKIRRKLRLKKIGKYDQERVDRLRSLKDDLQIEIGKRNKSRYYLGSDGQFADLKDFDISRMTTDFVTAFPEVPKQSITEFVGYAIYLYYIR